MSFLNLGRTACLIRITRVEIQVGDLSSPTPAFTYSKEYRGETICEAGKPFDEVGFEYERHITKTEIDDIRKGKMPIHIFGYVKYADIFGFFHTKGWCLRAVWDAGVPFFHVVGGRPYNYRTKDKASEDQRL